MAHGTQHISSPARMEAFSDGVIAVIITIMVLELKVPHQNGWVGLYATLPAIGVYLLSFTFTGIYWLNHHHLVHRTEETDSPILYANMAFLFCLSLTPFFTAYLLEKHIDSFSVALYIVSMVMTGLSFHLLRLAIARRLRAHGTLEPEDIAMQRKHVLSLLVYAAAFALAFVHSYTALGIIACVTAFWVTPMAGIKPIPEHQGIV